MWVTFGPFAGPPSPNCPSKWTGAVPPVALAVRLNRSPGARIGEGVGEIGGAGVRTITEDPRESVRWRPPLRGGGEVQDLPSVDRVPRLPREELEVGVDLERERGGPGSGHGAVDPQADRVGPRGTVGVRGVRGGIQSATIAEIP